MAFEYDVSPNRLDELISIDEAEAIASADPKAFGRDPRRVQHYLTRVGHTIRAYRGQVRQLHSDFQRANLAQARQLPSTLSPIDAVRYLTPEQLAAATDSAVAEKLEAAGRIEREASVLRSTAVARINEIKLVLGSLADDPTLPDPARAKLSQALDRFSSAEESLSELDGLFEE